MSRLLLFAVYVDSTWWWVLGLVIIGLVLIAVGRLAGRASVAGHAPPDQGPDLDANEQGLTPDIRAEDQKSSDSTNQ